MNKLLLLSAVALMFSCKPESSQRTKNQQTNNQRGDYDPTKPVTCDPYDSTCTPGFGDSNGVSRTTADYRITRNGLNDAEYARTLVAGVNQRTTWEFSIESNSSSYTGTAAGQLKARLKASSMPSGLEGRKLSGTSFEIKAQLPNATGGSVEVEVVDVNYCNSLNRFGSQCNDDYSFPMEAVQIVRVPYRAINGVNTGSGGSDLTCAILGPAGDVIGGIDGDGNRTIFDSIVDLGRTIIGVNNECE